MTVNYKEQIVKELVEKEVFEVIGDAVSIQDANFKILYQNNALKELIGDHTGEYCYHAYEKQAKTCEGCPLAATFKDGKIHKTERSAPTSQGTLHVEITTSPIKVKTGEIIAGIEVVRDITARKQIEEKLAESERRYRDLVETAHDMIQSVSPDGHYLFVNKAWLDTMGYTLEELKSITIFDVLHSECLEHCSDIFKKVMSGEPQNNVNAVFVTKNGRSIDVEGNIRSRFLEGKPIATHGIFRDVTERKRMEIKLKEKVKELEEFYNMTIGRELKMRELKKEIEKLKSER